ncbi:MAG: ECF transporter S component [Oscillospiraceae bacterium]|nr:ECF transporter S component [Oscillospiraceae bacterium]
MSQTKQTKWLTPRTVVTLAMLTAVALVVTWLCKAIPSVNGFLDFEFKGVVICIGGFTLGPAAAIVLSFLVPVVEFFTFSGTGPIGLIMNVAATASFCCPACYIYKRRHTMNGAVAGLAVGTVTLTAVMVLWNYLITPLYQGTPRAVIASMLLPVFLPFNLVKGGLNMAATLLLYKPVVTALRRAGLVPPSQTDRSRKFSGGFILFSVALLVTFVLLALVLLNVI